MKFKFIGEQSVRDITLELAGIVKRDTVIKKGDIVETEDPYYIERLKASAHYAETRIASTAKVITEKINKEVE